MTSRLTLRSHDQGITKNQQKKENLRKKRNKKDFQNKYRDIRINSSSNKSSFNKYNFEKKELIVKDSREDNI